MEVAVLDDEGKIAVREWITVPEQGDEPFKIPANLRAALEAKELIEPLEPDDPE